MSLGSLGEGKLVCNQAKEGSYVSLTCGADEVLSEVSGYYGQPTGYCGCPADQREDSVGNCPGRVTYATVSYGQCADSKEACFSGNAWNGDECCAYSLDSEYQADLSPLIPKDVSGCVSDTAHYIASGLCRGQNNCTIAVNATTEHSFQAVDLGCSPG